MLSVVVVSTSAVFCVTSLSDRTSASCALTADKTVSHCAGCGAVERGGPGGLSASESTKTEGPHPPIGFVIGWGNIFVSGCHGGNAVFTAHAASRGANGVKVCFCCFLVWLPRPRDISFFPFFPKLHTRAEPRTESFVITLDETNLLRRLASLQRIGFGCHCGKAVLPSTRGFATVMWSLLLVFVCLLV